jgi:hypothetical protein
LGDLVNSDSYGALRYRTPSTPQTAIAPPQLPKQRSHSLQLPKQRTACSSASLSHPLTLLRAIAPFPTSQHPFLTNHRDTEDTEKERLHPLQLPNSDRTPSNFPNSDRTPPTSQTAIALPPTSQKRSHSLQLPNILS